MVWSGDQSKQKEALRTSKRSRKKEMREEFRLCAKADKRMIKRISYSGHAGEIASLEARLLKKAISMFFERSTPEKDNIWQRSTETTSCAVLVPPMKEYRLSRLIGEWGNNETTSPCAGHQTRSNETEYVSCICRKYGSKPRPFLVKTGSKALSSPKIKS
jgi:hypothetical protein